MTTWSPKPSLPSLVFLAVSVLASAAFGIETSAILEDEYYESDRPLRWIRPALVPARFIPSFYGWGQEENVQHGADTHLPVIPGIEEALTQQYIRRYSSPGGLAWLETVMKRGAPYLAFIRREIEERDLPKELLYLPVIESGFLPVARSGSGAVGLWQFMRNSIAPFDMRVTDWVDERMDFWKSTKGALGKLEENYRILGDWCLALAAYNAGLGAIERLVSRTGNRDYWALSEKKLLKTESLHYVPKLLAVAYILSNPRRFGLDLNWPEDPGWTRIAVERTVDLDMLAGEAGIDGAELKRMNRELRYNVTPPDTAYYLKVRAAHAESLEAVLARDDLPLLRFYFHTIRYGDTLSVLARHYGITAAQITAANPGIQERYLKLGYMLKIPALIDVGPMKGGSSGTAEGAPVFDGKHTVKRGETLWSIALAYEVDPLVLAAVNGMELNDTLREGRTLKTPIVK